MPARWSLFSLAAAATLAAAPSLVHAQSASVQAQSLFDDGRKLLDAGKIPEACAAFESSEKLDPVVTTLLNLAECRELNHQLATAWGLFVDAGRMTRDAKDAKSQRFAKTAASHAKKLEPRLSKLTITVAPEHQVAGLEITRNDEPVTAASWNHALPIDGGTYTIKVSAPGHVAWTVDKTIKVEGDAQTIDVPALDDAPTPVATAPVAPVTAPAEAPVAATAPPHDPPSYVPAIAVGGGALVLGGAALGFSLAGDSKYNDAKKATTQAQQDSLVHQANTRRYVAQGVGIGAAVAAGAAVYLFFHTRSERQAEAVAIAPIAGPSVGGLAVVGRW